MASARVFGCAYKIYLIINKNHDIIKIFYDCENNWNIVLQLKEGFGMNRQLLSLGLKPFGAVPSA